MKSIILACLGALALANKQAYYDLEGDDNDTSMDADAPAVELDDTDPEPMGPPADVETAQDISADAGLNQYTFDDIVAMVKGNSSVQDLAADVTASFGAHYNEVVALLPEVCEGKAATYDENGNQVSDATGMECRKYYETSTKQAISVHWQTALGAVKTELEDLFLISQNLMAKAYADAMECKPEGCPCQKAGESLTVQSEGILTIQ